jgi:hypothetical protein
MQFDARNLMFGFIAGALAVPIFHQSMVLVLHLLGFTPNFPWNFAPMRGGIFSLPIPMLVNSMFWGGLWGVLFAAVAGLIPIGATALKGLAFGLAGTWLLGNGILVPFFKSGTFFWGFNPANMWRGALINGFFGVGVALIYKVLAKR